MRVVVQAYRLPTRGFSETIGVMRPVFAILALLLSTPLFSQQEPSAPRWRMQYFYNQEKTSLTINDFVFPSEKYGIAVGYVSEGKHEDPTQLLTADGGDHWALSPLKETPVSLFFLDDSLGWMVTTKGLWRTTEAGRNWTKLPKIPGDILRVCFTSEKDGYAVGLKKVVLQTHDGAQTWEPVKQAADQPGDSHYSAYVWVAFANPKIGLITGTNNPPRRFAPEFPDWLDPAATLRMRDIPHLDLLADNARWRRNLAQQIGFAVGTDRALSAESQREGNRINRILRAFPDSERSIHDRLAYAASVRACIRIRRSASPTFGSTAMARLLSGDRRAWTPPRHNSREGRRADEQGL